MHIKLSPQRRDDELTVSVTGDVITINGQTLDFGPLPEGATLPADAVSCEWIVGTITRMAGRIGLTLILPHGHNPSRRVAFPEPVLALVDGPVALPFDAKPKEEAND